VSDVHVPPVAAGGAWRDGMDLLIDERALRLDDQVLVTADEVRVLRLRGGAVGDLLTAGRVAASRLPEPVVRTLLDAGAVHPLPRQGAPASAEEVAERVAVVVPVLDRAEELDALLGALEPVGEVIVVDDGSADGRPIAAVAARHGARLLVRSRNGGPGAARSDGLAVARRELVAFVDSDVVPSPGWIARLLPHLDDPTVGIVAPRVASLPGTSRLEAYDAAASPLDLGEAPGQVRQLGRIAYLPSPAWLVRPAALPTGFAPGLRVAEDVDAVWRAVAAGWRCRYVPAVVVHHHPRAGVRAALRQRMSYGAGATALARRHPGGAPPLHLSTWSAVVLLGTASASPLGLGAALAAGAVAVVHTARRLPAPQPYALATRLLCRGIGSLLLGVPATSVRHWWPLLGPLAVVAPRSGALLVAGWVGNVLVEHRHRRPALGAGTYAVGRLLDDLAYGAGVWHGAWRGRTAAALLPRRSPAHGDR
jgi:mycofactocin glycosyltransferase